MKLLQEVTDDRFNNQLGKIQDAIASLEKLLPQFGPKNRPVGTQINGVMNAAEDLQKLATELKKLKEAR